MRISTKRFITRVSDSGKFLIVHDKTSSRTIIFVYNDKLSEYTEESELYLPDHGVIENRIYFTDDELVFETFCKTSNKPTLLTYDLSLAVPVIKSTTGVVKIPMTVKVAKVLMSDSEDRKHFLSANRNKLIHLSTLDERSEIKVRDSVRPKKSSETIWWADNDSGVLRDMSLSSNGSNAVILTNAIFEDEELILRTYRHSSEGFELSGSRYISV